MHTIKKIQTMAWEKVQKIQNIDMLEKWIVTFLNLTFFLFKKKDITCGYFRTNFIFRRYIIARTFLFLEKPIKTTFSFQSVYFELHFYAGITLEYSISLHLCSGTLLHLHRLDAKTCFRTSYRDLWHNLIRFNLHLYFFG